MALAEDAPRGFANGRESFREQLVERFAFIEARPEFDGLLREFLVGQRGDIGLERVDLVDQAAERLDVAIVGRAENGLGNGAEHGGVPEIFVPRPRGRAKCG